MGLHFSEVTDSSAVVHWSMSPSPIDNYRIAYVPFEGGKMTIKVFAFLLRIKKFSMTRNYSAAHLWKVHTL